MSNVSLLTALHQGFTEHRGICPYSQLDCNCATWHVLQSFSLNLWGKGLEYMDVGTDEEVFGRHVPLFQSDW